MSYLRRGHFVALPSTEPTGSCGAWSAAAAAVSRAIGAVIARHECQSPVAALLGCSYQVFTVECQYMRVLVVRV